jgi:hypothetical protein
VSQAGKAVELSGALSLEGPFLECVYAGYLLLMGKNVLERTRTGGIQHDILVDDVDGFEFYELTGQASIDWNKVARFRDTINQLAHYLKREEGGKQLVRSYFVSMSANDAWSGAATNVFEQLVKDSMQRLSCKVQLIDGVTALKQLLESGALGLRLINNRVYFAGPEEYAIRFDPTSGQFYVGFIKLDLRRFRALPFSFLPSHYWEIYYQTRLREVFEKEYAEKFEKLTIWAYPYYEGLKWQDLSSVIDCYREYLNCHRRSYPEIQEEAGLQYIFETYKTSRGNYHYNIYLFSLDEVVDKQVTSSLRGIADHIASKIKDQVDYLKDERINITLHSVSDTWTLDAWSEVNKPSPEHLRNVMGERIHVERGNDLLQKLLNRGVLGFRFRKANEITLCGPGVEAIRLGYNSTSHRYELMLADKPIYA